MKKKICIATPVDYSNFGNRLQNYAVHVICKRMNMEPTTLAVEYSYIFGLIPKYFVLKLINYFHLGNLLSKTSTAKSVNKSYAAWKFTNNEIDTIYIKNIGDFKKVVDDYDYYGIGGDQIFSPYWKQKIPFATFIGYDADKKICFSPSFGSDKLSLEYTDEIMKELEEIEHIAIREQSGVDMIAQTIDKRPIRICDPVVMLTREDWISASKKTSFKQDVRKTIIYFLGEYCGEYKEFISEDTNRKQCELVDVSRISNSKESTCDPFEFISFINQSECVYTDSFHAIMLALILNKRVVIFQRKGGEEMNTRIFELVERYHLENCLYSEKDNILNLGYYDCDNVNRILESERRIAEEYYEQFK